MKKIFVDTNVFVGFYHNKDSLHEHAIQALTQAEEFVTSEQVFVEIMHVLSRRVSIQSARTAGQELINRDITLLQPLQSEFDEAWKLFGSQTKLSFTDCINIVLAEGAGCDAIATFDAAYANYSKVPIIGK